MIKEVEAMAEGKKSFILYTDSYNMIGMLGTEQKGALLDAIFSIHGCCECPELDQATAIVFAGMKRYLLENMEKWEETRRRKSEGAKKARANDAKRKEEQSMIKSVEDTSSMLSTLQDEATVNVNVNVNENVNVNANERNTYIVDSGDENDVQECSTDVEPRAQDSISLRLQEKKEAEEHFEKLWALYPQKRGKNQVSDATKRALLNTSVEEMRVAIGRYTGEVRASGRQWLNGSTWFNGRFAEYVGSNYVPQQAVTNPVPGRYVSPEGPRDWSDREE